MHRWKAEVKGFATVYRRASDTFMVKFYEPKRDFLVIWVLRTFCIQKGIPSVNLALTPDYITGGHRGGGQEAFA